MLKKTFLPEEASKTKMENTEERFPKLRVLPPFSNRTLHHPSFMSLYASPGCRQCQGDIQTVHPMSPQEFFYTDPTMTCGPRRIPNHLSELRDFDCFQLNTPPSIMSTFPAPPNRLDPFRTGQHLTRNLGSPSWQMDSKLSSPTAPLWVVVQLTEMEDQAITNLLTLHHEEEGKLPTQQMSKVEEPLVDYKDCSSPKHNSADKANGLFSDGAHSRVDCLGKCWSDTELEAANTLITQFTSMEDYAVSSCSNLLLSDVMQEFTNFTDLAHNERVLSESEGDALSALLSLGITDS